MTTISIDFSAPNLDPRLSWLNSPAAATPTPSGLRVVPSVGDWWSRTADSSTSDPEKRRAEEAAPLLLLSPVGVGNVGNDENGNRGDFDAECSVACFHRRDYDQAGICVRASAACWLKANVERTPSGKLVLACCVTNPDGRSGLGWTDLCAFPLDERCCCCSGNGDSGGSEATGGIPGASAAIQLRVRRRGGDYSVEWAPPPPTTTDEKESPSPSFTRFRLCKLHEDNGCDDGDDNFSSLRVGVYASAPVAAGFVALFRSFKVGPPESGPLL